MSFFAELKRRNVFRVGIAYIVGGWLLLQLTDVLSELLDLPDVVGRDHHRFAGCFVFRLGI
jgi:hypothetical protein